MRTILFVLMMLTGLMLPSKGFCEVPTPQEIAETRRFAAKGYALAQFNLGWMYYNGNGVIQDYTEAMKWYKLAAAQGDADAQYNLGVGYDNGEGVRQDKRQAKEWFGKACDNGHQAGCEEYRKLNEEGY